MMTLQRNGTDGSGLDLKKVAKHRPSWMARLRQSPTVEASRSSPPTQKTFDTSINWNWSTGPVDRRLPLSFWAKAFYERQRAKGSSHNAAIRALAFKWIRILWRCWADRQPYDETR